MVAVTGEGEGEAPGTLFTVRLLRVSAEVLDTVWSPEPFRVSVPVPGVKVPLLVKLPPTVTEPVPTVIVPLFTRLPVTVSVWLPTARVLAVTVRLAAVTLPTSVAVPEL